MITTSGNSFSQLGIQLLGAISIAFWGALISYLYFKTVHTLGRLRVNKFYEIVGIDILMHTMSDQIGENDDFDRDSRMQQYADEHRKAQNKKKEEHDSVDQNPKNLNL